MRLPADLHQDGDERVHALLGGEVGVGVAASAMAPGPAGDRPASRKHFGNASKTACGAEVLARLRGRRGSVVGGDLHVPIGERTA